MNRTCITLALVAVAASLSGCYVAPPRRVVYAPPQTAAPAPEQFVEVVAYPAQGQSDQQLDRDRYECHGWAVKQTGFDPSMAATPPHQRVVVVQGGPPPGAQVANGAVTGAVLGAIVSNPGNSGAGALIGGILGATIGAVGESQRTAATQRVVQDAQSRNAAEYSAQEQRASDYRRALGACLAGRGYTVR